METWKEAFKGASTLNIMGGRRPPSEPRLTPPPPPSPPVYSPPRETSPPPDEALRDLIRNAHDQTRADNAEDNAYFVNLHRSAFITLANHNWQPWNAWNYLQRLTNDPSLTPEAIAALAATANEEQEVHIYNSGAPGEIDAPREDHGWQQVIYRLRNSGFDQEYMETLAVILDGDATPEELEHAFLGEAGAGPQGILGWIYDWAPGLRDFFGVGGVSGIAFYDGDGDVDMEDGGEIQGREQVHGVEDDDEEGEDSSDDNEEEDDDEGGGAYSTGPGDEDEDFEIVVPHDEDDESSEDGEDEDDESSEESSEDSSDDDEEDDDDEGGGAYSTGPGDEDEDYEIGSPHEHRQHDEDDESIEDSEDEEDDENDDHEAPQSSLPDYEPSPPPPSGFGNPTGDYRPVFGSDDDNDDINSSEGVEENARRNSYPASAATAHSQSETSSGGTWITEDDLPMTPDRFGSPSPLVTPDAPVRAGRPDGTPPGGGGGGQEYEYDDDGLIIRLRGAPASPSPASRRSSLKSSSSLARSPSGYARGPSHDGPVHDAGPTGDDDDGDDDPRNAIHNSLVAAHEAENDRFVETYKAVFSVLASNNWSPHLAWRFVKWLDYATPAATMAERIQIVSEIDERQLHHSYTHAEEEEFLREFDPNSNLYTVMRGFYHMGFAVDYLREYAQAIAAENSSRNPEDIYDDLMHFNPEHWIWAWAPALYEIWDDAGVATRPAASTTSRSPASRYAPRQSQASSSRRSSRADSVLAPGTQLYSPSHPPERPQSFDQWRRSPSRTLSGRQNARSASRPSSRSPSTPTTPELARRFAAALPQTPPGERRSSLAPSARWSTRNSLASVSQSPIERSVPGTPTSSVLARERLISPPAYGPAPGSFAAHVARKSPSYEPISSPGRSPAGSRHSSAGGSRQGSAGSRQGSAGSRQGSTGSRAGSAGSRPGSTGSHQGSAASGSRRSSSLRSISNEGSRRSSSTLSTLRLSDRLPSPSPRPRGIIKRPSPRRGPPLDPLRYTNRLTPPRRLPNTPTASHRPPSPRRSGPRVCGECGRPYPSQSPQRLQTPSPARPVVKDPFQPDGSSSPGSLTPVKRAPVKRPSVKRGPTKAATKAATKGATKVAKQSVQKAAPGRRGLRDRSKITAPDRFGG